MKIALLTDYILNRDSYTETVEFICELLQADHDVEIFTFAHAQGKVLGPLEKSSIHSTYLSHFLTSEEDFYKKLHHLPKLAESFHVCDAELAVSITRGFAQGIKIPNIPHLCFVYDFNTRPRGIMSRLLYPGVKNWIKNSFGSVSQLNVNSKDSLNGLKDLGIDLSGFGDIEVYPSPIRLEEYPNWELTKEKMMVLEGENLKNHLKTLESFFDKVEEKVFVLGATDLPLKDQKKISRKFPNVMFLGDKCPGDTREFFGKSRYFLSFRENGVPVQALRSLAMKTPVILKGVPIHKEFINEDSAWFFSKENDLLSSEFENFISQEFNPSKLRNNALRFNTSKLKINLKKSIDSSFS